MVSQAVPKTKCSSKYKHFSYHFSRKRNVSKNNINTIKFLLLIADFQVKVRQHWLDKTTGLINSIESCRCFDGWCLLTWNCLCTVEINVGSFLDSRVLVFSFIY